jgi:CDP-glucose 4,6-dehydratase
MIETDILIIGSGPTGLFTVFEAGLLKLDNSKAVSKLLWQPKWDTETAIQKTIEWYKEFYKSGLVSTRKNINEYFN